MESLVPYLKLCSTPLESVYIFQTPPFYLQFFLWDPPISHQSLTPNKFLGMLPHYNQSFSDILLVISTLLYFLMFEVVEQAHVKQRVHEMVF